MKSYLKQDNVTPTPTQHYLVWIRFRRKISYLSLLQFLIDLKKNTIFLLIPSRIVRRVTTEYKLLQIECNLQSYQENLKIHVLVISKVNIWLLYNKRIYEDTSTTTTWIINTIILSYFYTKCLFYNIRLLFLAIQAFGSVELWQKILVLLPNLDTISSCEILSLETLLINFPLWHFEFWCIFMWIHVQKFQIRRWRIRNPDFYKYTWEYVLAGRD